MRSHRGAVKGDHSFVVEITSKLYHLRRKGPESFDFGRIRTTLVQQTWINDTECTLGFVFTWDSLRLGVIRVRSGLVEENCRKHIGRDLDSDVEPRKAHVQVDDTFNAALIGCDTQSELRGAPSTLIFERGLILGSILYQKLILNVTKLSVETRDRLRFCNRGDSRPIPFFRTIFKHLCMNMEALHYTRESGGFAVDLEEKFPPLD